jgi:protein-S-isoprenylcysteine O-methyltransferase Ste14
MPAFPTGGDTLAQRWKALAVRRRTFITLAAVLPMLIVAQPTAAWYLAGLGLVLAGVAIRLISSGYITKAVKLTTNGPFALARHPLYLGGLLIAGGFCAMTGAWYPFPLIAILYASVYWPTIEFEERFLAERFGESYRAYCRTVPRFLPRLRLAPWTWAGFSWARVTQNHEPSNIAGVAAFCAAFALKLLE